jgi:hypothetical protein
MLRLQELFLGDDGQDMLCSLLGAEVAEDMYEKQLGAAVSYPGP